MTLPLTVSCFSKIRFGFTFQVPAHMGSPGKRAIKRACVCVWTRWLFNIYCQSPYNKNWNHNRALWQQYDLYCSSNNNRNFKKARRKALPTANKKPTASKKCRNVKTALHVNQPYLYLCHNTLLQKCVWVYSWVFPIAKSHCQPNSQKLQQRMNICLMQLLATLISKKCVGVGLLV